MPQRELRYAHFQGLRNKDDPVRLTALLTPEGPFAVGFQQADNFLIDNELKIAPPEGYTEVATGTFSDMFATEDEQRCFIVSNGDLFRLDAGFTWSTIHSGLQADEYSWVEVNNDVYMFSTADALVIDRDDNVRVCGLPVPPPVTVEAGSGTLPPGQYQVVATYVAPDGRESGAGHATPFRLTEAGSLVITDIVPFAGTKTRLYITSTDGAVLYRAYETTKAAVTWNGPLGELDQPLRTQFLQPPPPAQRAAFHGGKMYVAQWAPANNLTMIFGSEPISYEHFSYLEGMLAVPGRVYLLADADEGLLIGTDQRIYAYSPAENKLQTLAKYGVIPGRSEAIHRGEVYFMSNEGICKALPFKNLTESDVSLPPGRDAYGTVIEQGGVERYAVLLTQEGTARNPY